MYMSEERRLKQDNLQCTDSVTEEQKKELQKIVDAANDYFIKREKPE